MEKKINIFCTKQTTSTTICRYRALLYLINELELCGSPNYMAVEILREKGYDEMIDFWSLGITA